MIIPPEINIYFHFDKLRIEVSPIKVDPIKATLEYIEGMNLKEEQEVKEGVEDLNKSSV